MFEGIEIVGISRVGQDYALHFSDGSFGIFCAADLELMLGGDVSCLPTDEPKTYLH
jgi:hypothetical protein